jgi:tRNA C32,U32 (ribose-2'-O)-methylase TrmJ
VQAGALVAQAGVPRIQAPTSEAFAMASTAADVLVDALIDWDVDTVLVSPATA